MHGVTIAIEEFFNTRRLKVKIPQLLRWGITIMILMVILGGISLSRSEICLGFSWDHVWSRKTNRRRAFSNLVFE
jgi:hypothetical protein